jgi:hypothetical protein
MRVYSGIDGAVLATHQLDPQDVVPYDGDAYGTISRTGYALRRGRGSFTVGDGLDRWNEVRFDRSSNRLLLSVFRPVSQPYQDRLAPQLPLSLICDVEERWVAATLVS